jgi:hypothetical protein
MTSKFTVLKAVQFGGRLSRGSRPRDAVQAQPKMTEKQQMPKRSSKDRKILCEDF